jgi:hypothetical protein
MSDILIATECTLCCRQITVPLVDRIHEWLCDDCAREEQQSNPANDKAEVLKVPGMSDKR